MQAFLSVCLAVAVPFAPQSEAEHIAEVRHLVRALDPHTAYREGQDALIAYPDSVELRAWVVLAAARTDRGEEAVASATALTQSQPTDGWAWFALAGALMQDRERNREAPEFSARALEQLGSSPDALWLHAQALIAADRYEEAAAFTEGSWDDPAVAAAMLRQRARAFYYLAGFSNPDPEKRATALDAARRAVELAPDSADASFGLFQFLEILGHPDEAPPYRERARELSPGSIQIRQALWRALERRTDLDAVGKREWLLADIEDLLRRHERNSSALRAAYYALENFDANKERDALAEEILERHPDTLDAEWILVERYRAIGEELYAPIMAAQAEGRDAELDPELLARYRAALRAFLARERFHQSTLRGDAYRELFEASGPSGGVEPVSDEELLDIVEGMVAYEGINVHISHAQGPIALAERTSYYERAEQIVREGFDLALEKVESNRAFYATQADHDKARDYYLSILHDALGWVYFRSDRIDEAEVELTEAHELDPKNRDNLHHLGQLYEHNGERERAERYYVLGLNVQRPGVNPNRQALETLYVADRGSLDGFDAYLERIAANDAEARHAEVLDSRIAEPAPPRSFEMKTLDGATVSLESLKGRIAVVNFWGIWCYWCVIEMPEMQQLHDNYADDPDVVILTINNDQNVDQVPAWMQEKGYSFAVLLDNGFVAQTGVTLFPTTWFLDREGRLAFSKEGWSQELVQEYSWRIEQLRGSSREVQEHR